MLGQNLNIVINHYKSLNRTSRGHFPIKSNPFILLPQCIPAIPNPKKIGNIFSKLNEFIRKNNDRIERPIEISYEMKIKPNRNKQRTNVVFWPQLQ